EINHEPVPAVSTTTAAQQLAICSASAVHRGAWQLDACYLLDDDSAGQHHLPTGPGLRWKHLCRQKELRSGNADLDGHRHRAFDSPGHPLREFGDLTV